jgi:hypothetical protein
MKGTVKGTECAEGEEEKQEEEKQELENLGA